jgi:hypothetical protein
MLTTVLGDYTPCLRLTYTCDVGMAISLSNTILFEYFLYFKIAPK